MNDSYETKAAVLAAKENCDLPIMVSNAYGADGKLVTEDLFTGKTIDVKGIVDYYDGQYQVKVFTLDSITFIDY